jgi:putative drug exporter of the RND superfamily
MLTRLASSSFKHRRLVLLAWIAALVGVIVLAGKFGGEYSNGDNLEGTDSTAAYRLQADEFPDDSEGEDVEIVLHADNGLEASQPAIESYFTSLETLPGVLSVEPPDRASPAGVSADGTIASGSVTFDSEIAGFSIDSIDEAAAPLRAAGVDVEFASYWFSDGAPPESEIFGLIAAVIILLVAFGSAVAMGLPMLTALVGIGIGLGGVQLWANVIATPDFTTQVASMVGIGVGIDYALFIVTRYRTALERGLTPHDAVMEAIGTAGRAVVFAGVTVMISLMGMILMGLSFLNGLAVGTASSVAVAVLAAVTLLPAMLGFIGHRIDRFSIHRKRGNRPAKETVWHRWSRLVQRHPKGFAIGGLTVLLAIGAPTLGMRMASADMGNDPVESTTRKAYDLRKEAFGAGSNGPLLVIARTPDQGDAATVEALATEIASDTGVAMVTPVQPSASGQAAVFGVIPTTGPQEEETENLVQRMRSDFIADAGITAHVGGATASNIDFSEKMSSRLPIFIGAVLVLSFLLLMAVFRSVLVPLKAVILNLLSIGAAYGVMVAVFQWGWLGGLFNVVPAPIEPWAPMMLFAIVFGLSMDYEVFLLSSVQERYHATNDNSHAVVEGLASTARVITAAAAIMVCVFLPFVFGEDRGIKLIGLGLAVAVFVDATIVRMILVPSTMELLGRKNWWMPRWLDRIVPSIAVEAPPTPKAVEVSDPKGERVPV